MLAVLLRSKGSGVLPFVTLREITDGCRVGGHEEEMRREEEEEEEDESRGGENG